MVGRRWIGGGSPPVPSRDTYCILSAVVALPVCARRHASKSSLIAASPVRPGRQPPQPVPPSPAGGLGNSAAEPAATGTPGGATGGP